MGEKQVFISEEERRKCKQVVDAFAELYEMEDVIVLDAGRYGFVMLRYYSPHQGFYSHDTYIDSRELFEDLWEEWLDTRLIRLSKGTAMEEETLKDIFKALPEKEQKELQDNRIYFAEKAGIDRKELSST